MTDPTIIEIRIPGPPGGRGPDGSPSEPFASTGSTAERALPDRFAEEVNLLDFWEAIDTNWDNAMDRALAGAGTTPRTIVIPRNGDVPYDFSKMFSLPSNIHIKGKDGRPTLRTVGNGQRIFVTSGTVGGSIRDLIIDGQKDSKGGSHRLINISGGFGWEIENLYLKNSTQCLQIDDGSTHCKVTGCDFEDIDVHGIVVSGETTQFCEFTHNRIKRCLFGILFTNGTNRHLAAFNKTDENRIELIGVTFLCTWIRIIGNNAQGCGDNGISVTGRYCLVAANTCQFNDHSGIGVYGGFNTIVGNVLMNNGQRFLVDGWNGDGINVSFSWGGIAYANMIYANVCGDTQEIKTQRSGIGLSGNGYSQWAPGQSVNVNDATKYRYYGLNIYYAASSGTTGDTPPTHTEGTASDGSVNWTYIATAEPALGSSRNWLSGNNLFDQPGSLGANRVSPISVGTSNPNRIDTFGYMQGPSGVGIRWPDSFDPDTFSAANVGDIILAKTVDGKPWYMSENGSKQLGDDSLVFTNATRPPAADYANKSGYNTDTGMPEWSDGTFWTDALGRPIATGIMLDYNYGTGTYLDNGDPVAFSLRNTFGRTGSASLREPYPSTSIVDFSANTPRMDSRGVIIGTRFTNHFPNSLTPTTRAVSLPAGTYSLEIVGPGSAALSGGPTGIATDQNPVGFVLAETTEVTVTITDQPIHVNLLSIPSGVQSAGIAVTDPIKTESSAVQRAQESLTLDLQSFNLERFTAVIIAKTPPFRRGTGTYLSISNANGQNRLDIRNSTANSILAIGLAGNVQTTGYPSVAYPGNEERFCLCASLDGDLARISINGLVTQRGTLSATPVAPFTRAVIGSQPGALNQSDAFIERIILLPNAVSDERMRVYSQLGTWEA